MSLSALEQITVVLVSPQAAGNVGSAARAVKNMGLSSLAIVEPRPHHDPDEFRDEANRLAVDAKDVLDAMRVEATLDDLVRPSTYIVATTAKGRHAGSLTDVRIAASEIIETAGRRSVAILFGREDHGLPARLVSRSNKQLTIPANPVYPVLNLAQAVMVVAYELRREAESKVAPTGPTGGPPTEPTGPTAEMLDDLYREGEAALGEIDFLLPHNRVQILAEVATLAERANPTSREVNLLRGICHQIRWLAGKRPGIPDAD